MIADGSNAKFRDSATTTASRQAIWRLWTDPSTWQDWDRGLRGAEAASTLILGARGTIVSLSGRKTSFRVTEWSEHDAYGFVTALPFAALTVRRFFEPGDATRFTHEVSFSGPLARFWASVLGPGFRRALPATMSELARRAEAAEAGARERR